MSWLWRVLGVAYYEFVWIRRQWMWLAQQIAMVLGLVGIFSFWGGVEALRHMVIALLVVSGFNTGLNLAAQSIGWDKVGARYEKIVASPLTPQEYLLGSLIGDLPFFVANVPFVLLLAVLTGIGLQCLLAVVLLSLAAMLLGLFLSLSVVLRLKNPMNISAVTNPLSTLTTILPPVFYTPLILPEPIRTICVAVPTTALVDLGRALASQTHAYPVHLSLASIATWMIATALLMKYALKWGLE